MYGAYTSLWVRDRYVQVEAPDFTFTGQRSERARDLPADPDRAQTVDSVDSPSDAVVQTVAEEYHGINQFGFPDDTWDSPDPGYGQDEKLVDRSDPNFQSRHVDNGAPAHHLRAAIQLPDVSETDRSGYHLDPEARLLDGPSGPDSERLLRGGPGGFNAYAANNSHERHPLEGFVRQDRSMHDPAGLESFYDVRPLFYNRSNLPHDVPATPADGNWGFVFDAWDSFTPEYNAEAPYDRAVPVSPAMDSSMPVGPLDDWGW